MLEPPLGGVGGINRHHPQLLVGAHLGQPVAELPSGDAGYGAPQPLTALAAPQGLAALGTCLGEVEVLDRDHPATVGLGQGDELADRCP
jgi:hypothetical protein